MNAFSRLGKGFAELCASAKQTDQESRQAEHIRQIALQGFPYLMRLPMIRCYVGRARHMVWAHCVFLIPTDKLLGKQRTKMTGCSSSMNFLNSIHSHLFMRDTTKPSPYSQIGGTDQIRATKHSCGADLSDLSYGTPACDLPT